MFGDRSVRIFVYFIGAVDLQELIEHVIEFLSVVGV